uniref:Orphan protein n=1 Tax=Meloidogyne hapla TaxID=6305 RepID=A0A1I8C2D7_MELHA
MSMNENNNLKEVIRVNLKQKRNFNSSTAQTHLDAAIHHFEQNDGALSSEAAWMCVSLQLKNFLIGYDVDAGNHKLKTKIIFFLEEKNNEFADQLIPAWLCLEE